MENKANRYDILPMYTSLKRDYDYNLRADCYGFHVSDAYGNTVYKDGEYRGEMYRGADAKDIYRERVLKLLGWALVNAPTPEVRDLERYIREHIKTTFH